MCRLNLSVKQVIALSAADRLRGRCYEVAVAVADEHFTKVMSLEAEIVVELVS